MLGYLSKNNVESMVHANLMVNCPVTPENVTLTHKLFEENVKGLRGKTFCQKAEQVVTDYV